jgi:hypothetical protein
MRFEIPKSILKEGKFKGSFYYLSDGPFIEILDKPEIENRYYRAGPSLQNHRNQLTGKYGRTAQSRYRVRENLYY